MLHARQLRLGTLRDVRRRSARSSFLAAAFTVLLILAPAALAAKGTTSPRTVAQIALVQKQEPALLAERGSRYRYLVLRDSLHKHVGAVHAANPRTQLFVHKNASFIAHEPDCPWRPFQGTLVDWCQAQEHPEWLLHDRRTGKPAVSEGYPWLRMADISHPGFRAAAIDAAIARLEDAQLDGSGVTWDGVFLDDVNLHPGHGLDGAVAGMSDEEYRRQMMRHVIALSEAVHARGFQIAANVALDPWDQAQVDAVSQLARHLDVVSREYFIRWGQGREAGKVFSHPQADSGNDWLLEIRRMTRVQRNGAAYLPNVYGMANERQVQRYARASFLLAYRRGSGSALIFRPDATSDPFARSWTRDVGAPRGQMRRTGRMYHRTFAAGLVVVNPHPSKRARIRTRSAHRYKGKCTRRIALKPTSGTLLARCRH